MATMLSDKEIKKLIGTVIMNGDEDYLRPNSYVLRLGSQGEFMASGKEFELGKKHKGIRVPPGQSVGISAFEMIDFSENAVRKIFPSGNLHGFLSPITNLAREGIIAPSTQIDAGYRGVLNWTINNTSGKRAEFIYGEELFRLTIFLLQEGENPDKLYDGQHQNNEEYSRSKRKGAPQGMRDFEWVDAETDEGPEEQLKRLIASGYPWDILGYRLKELDGKLKTVTQEYGKITDSIAGIQKDIKEFREEWPQKLEAGQDKVVDKLWDKIEIALKVGGGGIAGVLMAMPEALWKLVTDDFRPAVTILGCVFLLYAGYSFWKRKRKN